MNNWVDAVVIINLIMVICGPVGAFIAIRNSMSSAGQIIQDRVQRMMHDENELLTDRLKRCEEGERERDQKLDLIVDTLKKKYKIELEIDGNTITLRDQGGTHVTRIKSATKEE